MLAKELIDGVSDEIQHGFQSCDEMEKKTLEIEEQDQNTANEEEVFDELFGESSQSSSNRPNGLFELCITEIEQKCLLELIEREHWFNHSIGLDQKVAFGSEVINSQILNLFQRLLMKSKKTKTWICSRGMNKFYFNQMIANYYSKGDYIKDHVDLLQFQDGILICNLVGKATIQFKHVDFTDWIYEKVLEEGHVLFLTGSSRYDWSHGILPIQTYERISLTLRQLKLDI